MIHSFRDHVPQIHPSAFVHPDATVIGEVILHAGVSIWPGAVLRGDMGLIEIGEDSNVQDNSVVHMTSGLSVTRIGARCTVGHRAILHGCIVDDDCLIGMGSILLDNCHIQSFSVVGAGALVTGRKEYGQGVMLLGSPATVARPTSEKDRHWIDYSWRHYKEVFPEYPAKLR